MKPATTTTASTLPAARPVLARNANGRFAVPDAAQLAKDVQAVRKWTEGPYRLAATAGADPRSAAGHLLAWGASAAYEPGVRYALLREARDMAVSAGDAPHAVEAVQLLARDFDVNGPALEVETLENTAARASAPEDFAALARAGMQGVEARLATASSAEDYAAADRLARAVATWAIASRDAALLVKAQSWGHDVAALAEEAVKVAPAFAKLQSSPDDAEANLAVGQFLCLHQDDWPRGLPHLAKGSDPAVAALAKLELTHPTKPESWQRLGDGWWEQSRSYKGIVQWRVQQHACRWYAELLPRLTGPRRALVEQRAGDAGFTPADLEQLRQSNGQQ